LAELEIGIRAILYNPSGQPNVQLIEELAPMLSNPLTIGGSPVSYLKGNTWL
jgi:hypothetical protein